MLETSNPQSMCSPHFFTLTDLVYHILLVSTRFAGYRPRQNADGLIKNLHAPLNEGETVIVASFADVDNLTQSSTVGRLLGDIVGSRLSQQGFTVVDIRTRQNSIFIQEQGGEFVLSRDVRALSKANNAACVVAGTFGRLGKSTVVSVRMIRASDNVILSSADGVLVRGR